MKGVNAVDGLTQMAPDEAIFMINMRPAQYGAAVRTGYKEWVTAVGTGGVRTLMPYTGSASINDRLFAASSLGIHDISASGTAPAVLIAFPSVSPTSGYGIFTGFTTLAGQFGCYTDEQNGYYTWTEGGAWLKVTMGGGGTQISGVDPALFAGVTIFKSRLWFVERGSSRAWYLPVGSVYGVATAFNFGNKFKKGGTLEMLFNWTVDGGEGVDDYLVAVSSAGDVVVYKGNDPASATDFNQHGTWFIGPPPVGRRIGGTFGGELYLLSSYGLLPMSALLAGQVIQQDQVYASRKITPLVNNEMAATRQSRGWEVKLVSKESTLLISSPKRDSFPYAQFAQSLNNQAWSVYRAIPYLTGDEWHSSFFIASEAGTVYMFDGNKDAVSLDGLTSVKISWSCLQSFQGYGEEGLYHIPQYCRPVFIANKVPDYFIEIRFDYNLSDVFGAPVSGGTTSGSLWDAAIWDVSVWGGDFIVSDNPQGAAGLGRVMAVALNGTSDDETTLIRYDLMFETGGML
jgi:hypothetical protein